MEEKTKDIYIEAQSSFLKDSYGNFILPRTTTGLVTDSDGKSVDERLALCPSVNDIENIRNEISFLDRKISNLDLKIKYTNAIQDLRHEIYINEYSENKEELKLLADNQLNSITDEVMQNQLKLINDRLSNFNERINKLERVSIDDTFSKLISSKINKAECEQIVEELINEKLDETKQQISDLYNIASDSIHLSIELYEAIINMDPDIEFPDTNRIAKIYKYLFDREEITKEEIPENIWNKIESIQNAELIKKFLNN